MRDRAPALPNTGRAPQVAATDTLSHALRNLGHKQKPWMVSSLPPSTASAPSPSPHTAPRAKRLPASTSALPHAANMTTCQADVARPRPAMTVLPSPAPSQDVKTHASTSNHGHAERSSSCFLDTENTRANTVSDTSPEIRFMESVRRAAFASKRAAEEDGHQAEKRNRAPCSGQEELSSLPLTANQPSSTLSESSEFPRRPQDLHAENDSPSLTHDHSLLPNRSSGQTSSPQLVQDAHVPPPPTQVPHSPSRRLVQHPCSISAEPVQSAAPRLEPAVQQPTAPASDWYTLEQCLSIFYQFQASYMALSNSYCDSKRMQLLRDATLNQDWSYLTMHQYYCLSSYMPDALPIPLQRHPNANQAHQVICGVLGPNDRLSPAALKFFSNYPFPMQHIAMAWPQKLAQQLQLLLRFITCSTICLHLHLACKSRKYPPVTRELEEVGVSSHTFQRLLFIAFLRRIWQPVPPRPQLQKQFEDLAVAMFVQNRMDFLQHQTLVARNSLLRLQIPHVDKATELHQWSSKFEPLVKKFDLALGAQGSSLVNPPERRQSQVYSLYEQQQRIQQQQQRVLANNPPLATYPNGTCRHSDLTNAHMASVAIQQTHQPPPQTIASRETQLTMPLLAHSGWIHPQQREPNPVRFSLHQANLRSPLLQARDLDSPLYHYTCAFAINPTRLSNAGQAVERWTFTLSQSEMQCLPMFVPSTLGAPETQTVIDVEKTKTVRLRCVKWPSNDNPNMHTWSIADTCWIPHSYFKFNGTCLQQRKKVYHNKDLPIDVTGLLRQGENTLETTVMAMSDDTSYLQYLVAIEVLGVTTHNSIIQCCLDNVMPTADTISLIKKKLSRFSEDNDDNDNDNDDLSIVETHLTINLFDPFSASKICDIPVRSKACLHLDCFDLETFLQTRRRKSDASVTDQWRCPICNSDARPSELVVDGFLVQVKKKLETLHLTHTRAIIVDQHGTWNPKNQVSSAIGVQHGEKIELTASTPPAKKPLVQESVEVIDLSD